MNSQGAKDGKPKIRCVPGQLQEIRHLVQLAIWDPAAPLARHGLRSTHHLARAAEDESCFNEIAHHLRTDMALVALNFGVRKGGDSSNDPSYSCFHETRAEPGVDGYLLEPISLTGDDVLRHMIKESPAEGAYLTDLVKFDQEGRVAPYADSQARRVAIKLNQEPEWASRQVAGLAQEIRELRGDTSSPLLLIALGRDVERTLETHRGVLEQAFGDEFEIRYSMHYSLSNPRSPEAKRESLKSAINGSEWAKSQR